MTIIDVNHATKEYQLGTMQSLANRIEKMKCKIKGEALPSRNNFKAIDDVTFSIESGEVVGLIGHNGAGKSTLLKMLSRITVPTKGSVAVHGRVAPLIEVGAGLVGELSGRENIYLNGAILGMSKAEINLKLDEIIAFSELEAFIDTPVKRYSSGMQVRLGFSIATSIDADVLIVDEVLAVGDLAFQRKCMVRMESIIRSRNCTVFIVSHNVRQLERICNRMLLMDHGRLVMDDSPSLVCTRFHELMEKKIEDTEQGTHTEIAPMETSGEITVVSVEVCSDGDTNQGSRAFFHRQLIVRVNFIAHTTLDTPELVIGFHTTEGLHIFSSSNLADDERPSYLPGARFVELHWPDLILRPGLYAVRFAMLDKNRRMIWYGENLVSFNVIAGDYIMLHLPALGMIDCPVNWKYSVQSMVRR